MLSLDFDEIDRVSNLESRLVVYPGAFSNDEFEVLKARLAFSEVLVDIGLHLELRRDTEG